MKKTTPINIMVCADDKRRLQDKAKQLGLTLTSYIEKVAREPVCFLDSNVRTILQALQLK